jgi:hypothetical protein
MSGSGWYGLLGILREGERERSRPVLESCPNDGEPLIVAADGDLFCPYDGWRP